MCRFNGDCFRSKMDHMIEGVTPVTPSLFLGVTLLFVTKQTFSATCDTVTPVTPIRAGAHTCAGGRARGRVSQVSHIIKTTTKLLINKIKNCDTLNQFCCHRVSQRAVG